MEQDFAIVDPLALDRGQAAAFAQRQQHVVHRPGAQFIGQFQPVGEQLVPVGIDETDVALGDDLSALAVPGQLIGANGLAIATQDHIAEHSQAVAIVIIACAVGFEPDVVRLAGGGSGKNLSF